MMKSTLHYSGRVAVTMVMVLFAAIVGWRLWIYYMDDPWTRDGRVRADVVELAPDVSGLVSEVLVKDNDHVEKGQVIFRVDPDRFALALRQADARVDSTRAAVIEAAREANRYRALTALSVSQEKQQQTEAALQEATAAYEQARADRDTAKLNLDRTAVTASEPGIITNFDLLPGNYVTAGKAVTALVATETIRVEGYFEETKLDRIHVGAPASVRLLGTPGVMSGHVDSIAGGIEDRERETSSGLMANINPTFSWVRLAQRIPVRIQLDHVPDGIHLVPGRTATVKIESTPAESQPSRLARLLRAFG